MSKVGRYAKGRQLYNIFIPKYVIIQYNIANSSTIKYENPELFYLHSLTIPVYSDGEKSF